MVSRHRLAHITGGTLTYLIFGAVFIIVVFPLVWMFYTSFKQQWEIFADPFAMFCAIRCCCSRGKPDSASTMTVEIRRCHSNVTPPKYGSLQISK